MPKTGSRVSLICFTGQRFGAYGRGSVVIDPEVRRGQRPGKPQGYRHALMECHCGTRYLAQLSHLYRGRSQTCPECSARETYRKRRKVGGLVSRNGNSWSVNVYIGRYRTRAEADAIARRARAFVLPEKDAAAARNGSLKTLT